ncbi:MAG TPA: secondary thiamine-phosphate synthase enzyme YjbQ [bacterium]|nr:secondary thiamine-phosphate synthase enzyme YjbQ [bacterium]
MKSEIVRLDVSTAAREQLIDITTRVQQALTTMGARDGMITVFVPHTTAGVTINENADPDVVHDILLALDKAVPAQSRFRHGEGNSTAHVKSSLVGSSLQALVQNGRLVLGTWQGIYFCEFDGPRNRQLLVQATID